MSVKNILQNFHPQTKNQWNVVVRVQHFQIFHARSNTDLIQPHLLTWKTLSKLKREKVAYLYIVSSNAHSKITSSRFLSHWVPVLNYHIAIQKMYFPKRDRIDFKSRVLFMLPLERKIIKITPLRNTIACQLQTTRVILRCKPLINLWTLSCQNHGCQNIIVRSDILSKWRNPERLMKLQQVNVRELIFAHTKIVNHFHLSIPYFWSILYFSLRKGVRVDAFKLTLKESRQVFSPSIILISLCNWYSRATCLIRVYGLRARGSTIFYELLIREDFF